jgi:peptide deformylase
MAVLPIVTGTENPLLRRKTKPLSKVTKEIRKLLKDMGETLKIADGVGIAAPQVASSLRVCLAMVGGKIIPLISPEIIAKSDETTVAQEGCLSLPGVWLDIPRSKEITLTYLDGRGKRQERKLKDFDARVVQHEVDHLDGVLIVDYAS